MKYEYEVQVLRDGVWTNDIAGCPNGTQTVMKWVAEDIRKHLQKLWPEASFRVVKIGKEG